MHLHVQNFCNQISDFGLSKSSSLTSIFMIDKLIGFSIKNKLIILFFVAALIGWGIYSLTKLPIDALPDITNNQVQVSAIAPALAAQDVEQTITSPLEITMANIPGIIEIRSVSRFGLSVITIVFREDVDIYRAREQVFQKIQTAQDLIPQGVAAIEMSPIATGLGEIYQYFLQVQPGYEKKYSLDELRTIQDWVIKRQLEGTPGVAEINSFGGYIKQYEVAVDPEKLRSQNITIKEIFDALQSNNQNTGGAYIEKLHSAYFIRGIGLVKTLDDVGKIVVKNTNGIPVLIRDVAQVQFGNAVRYGAMTVTGTGEAVGGVILMLRGENSMQVINAVKSKIVDIQKTLPNGIVITPFLDRSNLINRAIHTVSRNLIEGGLIVMLILILFLGNLRAGIVVASVIPLSMLFALGMMNLFGVSANLMSLGAIDFGLIVDGAVIIVEAIVFGIHYNSKLSNINKLSQSQMDEQVFQSAVRIRKAAAFGEIIILMVYIPILTLVGVEGKMFRPMAQTVSFAIIGALILSLTYVPMMSALLLSKKVTHKKNVSDRIMNFLQRIYRPVILFALRRKALVAITSFALLVISYLLFSRLGGEFIPTLQEGDFTVEFRLQPGSSLSQTIQSTIDAGNILKKNFPEVKEVVSRIGVASIPTDPDPIETAMFSIILKDKSQWISADNEAELADKMKQALSVIPGINYEFSQPIQLRFNELLSGSRQDVAVKIYGDDLDMLARFGTQAAAIISKVSGAQDVLAERTNGLPEITVEYNRDKIAQFGLSIADVNQVLEAAFAGAKAGIVYEGDRQFDLVIRFDKQHRKDLYNVQNLFITLPNGNQIPLSEVANVKFQEGPSLISRDNTKRRIAIGLNVRNRDVQSVVTDIQTQLAAQLKLPTGYLITYGGAFQNLIDAKKRLMIAVPVALALIFVLLFFTFDSIKESFLIFTAIPFAAIGGVFALLIRGMPFSISAGVGFIALFGVAVLNGIVLISFFNQLKKEGRTNINRRILEGVKVRLRPVVMTASVASLGFLPMAISATAGAEVQRPLATVVIGGLITSTILTLIVLPVLYSIFMQKKKIKKRKGSQNSISFMFLLIAICLLLIGTGLPAISNAQQPAQQPLQLTIHEAISLALKNNQSVKSAEYFVQQQQALKKTAVDLNKTSFQYNFDNTAFNGNQSIGVQQSFSLPVVYNRNGRLLNEQVILSEKSLNISKADLVRNVKIAYYQFIYGEEYLKVLIYQDSIYKNFVSAANSRYKNGETNYLEKVTADATYQQIILQRKQTEADIIVYGQELQKWLYTTTPVEPATDQLEKLSPSFFLDTSISKNPFLNYYQQNIHVAAANLALTKSRALPDLSLGVSKLIGNSGFGFGVGVGIPLWLKPFRARSEAAKIGVKIAEADYTNVLDTTKAAYSQQLQQYEKWNEQLNYYETAGLKQADEIIQNAESNYKYGSISYIDYIQNLTQAFNIKLQYLNALNQYNQSIININYLLGNN